MANFSILQLGFMWACPALQVGIAILMLRRGQVKRFPFFFLYIVLHFCQFLVAYTALRTSYTVYFYVYWGWVPLETIMTLLVIEELFKALLAPYRALRGLWLTVFRVSALTLCVLAAYSAYAAPGTDQFRIIAGLVVMDRSASFIETGLLLVLIVMCSVLGISWKNYQFGIASGMGISIAVGLVNSCVRAQLGRAADPWYGLVQASAFAVGLLVWTYSFASEQSSVLKHEEGHAPYLAAWNLALEGVLRGDRPSIGR